MSSLTMNSFYIGNNIVRNGYDKKKENCKINSKEIKKSIFQRNSTSNNFIINNSNYAYQKKNDIEISKGNDLNNSDENLFYKQEMFSYNNTRRGNSNNLKKLNNSQKPLRFESYDNVKNKNHINSMKESFTGKNFIQNKNYNRNINNNNLNNKTENLNLDIKIKEINSQLEEYEKIINKLKEENNHLRNIILNSGIQLDNNSLLLKGSLIKKKKSEYLNQLELLTQKLNSLNKEYENYKNITKLNSLKLGNLKDENYYNNEIIMLKSENENLKNEYKSLKEKYKNSDKDYVQLLKRNENLNKEIFKLKDIINKQLKNNNFLICNFSFEIKNKRIKNKKHLQKDSIKKFNNIPFQINNDNLKLKTLNKDNCFFQEELVYNIENENNSLKNKIQTLEDKLHDYLKNKINKKKKLEGFRSWSKN